MHPFEVTAADIHDLMAASEETPSALSVLSGRYMIGPAELHATQWPEWETVVRSDEVRDLLASATKHVDRLFVTDHRLTRVGATLVALLVNERRTAILDNGTPVAIIKNHAE
jgi:hypothetical protein